MFKMESLEDASKEANIYQVSPQDNLTSNLKEVTEYVQQGTTLNATFMQKVIDEINRNNPIGVIHSYAGDLVPEGYLFCDGSEVSREIYADLFKTLGTTYGEGDGTSTFLLPNLNGKTVLGRDNKYTLASNGGEESHILSVAEMPSHTHVQNAHTHNAIGSVSSAGVHDHSASSASAGAHTHNFSGSTANAGIHSHSIYHGNGAGPQTSPYQYPTGSGTYNTWAVPLSMELNGNHTHSISGTAASNGAHAHTVSVASGGAHTHEMNVSMNAITSLNANSGEDVAHNNMMPYLTLNYIIKY